MIKLRKGTYLEQTLVKKLCTEKQYSNYCNKNTFNGGKDKSGFLDKLSQYCDYEYDPEEKKYTILSVHDIPKTIYESRLHKGIYQFLAPLILHEIVNNHDHNNKATVTALDLALKIKMINPNYNHLKFDQEAASTDMEIPIYILAEYFNKADNRIDDYMRRCIKYLLSFNCIIGNEVHIIETSERQTVLDGDTVLITKRKNRHRADDEEMKLYSRLVDRASKFAGIHTHQEKWYGKKAKKYQKKLDELLQQHGIEYVCRGFELWYVDMKKCKKLLDEFSDISLNERTFALGEVFKVLMDENSKKQAAQRGLDNTYIEHFQNLSSITVLKDAENVRPKLKSAKTNQEHLIDRAKSFNVDYKVLKDAEID